MNFSILINIITLFYLIILQLLLHALMLLARQLVMHPLLIKFAASSLTLDPLKHSSTNVLFLVTIHQSLLLMIYGSFCLLVQQHPRHLWPLKKSGSLNSIVTLSLTTTLLLLSIPQVFDTTSFLVLISLTNAASPLIMKIIRCNEWNTLFLSMMLLNSSSLIITLHLFHHLNLNSKTTFSVTQLSTLMLCASLMLNTNRSTSMTLPSTNIIFCLISIVIFLTSFLNTKSYLMACLESIRVNKFTLTLNLELSQCITALILFLTYTDKPKEKGT